jgi:hypothetical protein
MPGVFPTRSRAGTQTAPLPGLPNTLGLALGHGRAIKARDLGTAVPLSALGSVRQQQGRLYWRWILYNSVAFIALLTAVAVMVWLSVDVLDLAVGNRSLVCALLVATFGALLFGGVLGSLQWLVVRERVPVPRRRWVATHSISATVTTRSPSCT